MLTLTENAAEAIKGLVESEDAGLRISTEEGEDDGVGIRLEVAEAALEGDKVVVEHGAHVFLDAGAALILDNRVLDVTTRAERVSFAITARD
ncbi:MAG: HesB/YadR/YfhF-family protein [Actinobacteria bacterium]|nr:MAG: HesB/YadR/YfhF-family protein [Actinomycetota bacterium]